VTNEANTLLDLLSAHASMLTTICLSSPTKRTDQVCGELTALVTLGFVYGLMKAQPFFNLKSVPEKNPKLKQAGVSLLGLVLCAAPALRSYLSPYLMATLVALCSGFFASSVAFQFFQIPNLVSSVALAEHKAACLSFWTDWGSFLQHPSGR
jgi:hypothetical protein